MQDKDLLTEKIIGCCFKVYNELGPGFNEKIYHNALRLVLKQERLKYQIEKTFKVSFQSISVGNFKADLIVEDRVIVELKALTGNIPNIFESQVLSYLKASGLKIGLLVNFGNRRCQIKRLAV
ncbi:MAG: GxxExxY protein [Candidatus Mariimomonas ferrooxydans]